MARLARLTLPGHVHHVIQRGNNRQAIFTQAADYAHFLELMDAAACKFHVALHAYVLMPNHFHVLATPQTAEGLPQMMQALGRDYVRYFNRTQQRTGTLWEGRYRSTVVQGDPYLLACMVSMDLNPVRAGLVQQPANYPWSSHMHYIGQRSDKCLTAHAHFWALGNTPFAREAAYREMVSAGLTSEQQAALSSATLQGWALGAPEFVAQLQKLTNRRVQKSQAGRPVSKPLTPEK
jgi:putative transposase